MPQPIDASPPWWDGTIAIALTPEQWKHIIGSLSYDVTYLLDDSPVDLDLINFISKIINRIEESLDDIAPPLPPSQGIPEKHWF